jgi:hypothetical protein
MLSSPVYAELHPRQAPNSYLGRSLSSLFSLFAPRVFHNSFPIKRFHTLSKKCRVYTNSSHSGIRHFPQSHLFSFQSVPHSFALFCTHAKRNSFPSKQFQTPCEKHPRWGHCHATRSAQIRVRPLNFRVPLETLALTRITNIQTFQPANIQTFRGLPPTLPRRTLWSILTKP